MSDLILNYEDRLVRKHREHPTRSAITRFLEKILVSEVRFYEGTPCWEWQGCKSKTTGYGQFKIDARRGAVERKSSPHRFSYEYFVSEIPEGYEPHHKCYNRGCCSPFHLELKTHQENMIDRSASTLAAINAAKTHCNEGHEFTAENTYLFNSGRNRMCKTCNARRQREFQARKRKTAIIS